MTPEIADILLIALIAFCAALAQGATGFGFAIIALPFLLLVTGRLDAVGLTIILQDCGGRRRAVPYCACLWAVRWAFPSVWRSF